MPSRNPAAGTGIVQGDDRPVEIVGEPIPCRDAKHRIWQALDLLQSDPSKRPMAAEAKTASVPMLGRPARRQGVR
jgi:hypothetical protein